MVVQQTHGTHDGASTSAKLGAAPGETYCWLLAIQNGSTDLATAAMVNMVADSNTLSLASQITQKMGSSSQTFESAVDNKYYTISEMIQKASELATKGGNDEEKKENQTKAASWQSAAGQAQAEQSQQVSVAQQFTSQQTNQATSVDTSQTNLANSVLQNLNSAYSGWVQLTGSISA